MAHQSTREKQIVIGGGVLAVIFIFIQFIYLPAYDKHAALQQTLAGHQQSLQRMKRLEKEYQALTPNHEDAQALIKNRENGFTLFSFLDRQAAQSGVKSHIDYMKPKTREIENQPFSLAVVKLRLQKIVYSDFIHFINRVESQGNGIRIVSMSLTKSGKTGNLLDAVIEVQTLTQKGDGI